MATVPPPLPASLKYLDNVLRELLLRAESVDESEDTTALCMALKQRIESSSKRKAIEILRKDKLELDAWLHGQEGHPGAYVSAFMSASQELEGYLRTFQPPKGWRPPRRAKRCVKRLSMDIPPGFELRREGSGLFMFKGTDVGKRHSVGVTLASRNPSPRQILKIALEDPQASQEPVAFGPVTGSRLIYAGKTGSYFLKTGGVEVIVLVEGDSRLIEPYLNTLTVTEIEI